MHNLPMLTKNRPMKQLSLPRHLFLFSVTIGLFVPFVARLPSVPTRGWEWFTDYIPGIGGILFFSAFNLIPAVVLFAIGKASKRAPLAYWFALAAALAFLLWAHGTVNLRSSSTAAIALLFIPIYAVGAVAVGWAVGWLAHVIVKNDRAHVWLAGFAIVAAVTTGVATSVNESTSIAKQEAQFPSVSVMEIPLTKRVVYGCDPLGRVEVLAADNFDSQPGNEIAVLGVSAIALLDPLNYTVKSTTPFKHDTCNSCVHMYPYVAPDGKGGLFVATSDGLSNSSGRLLWASNSATSFSRVVPIQISPGNVGYFTSYFSNDHVDFRNVDGKILWSAELPVTDIGAYILDGRNALPFAITGYRESRQLQLFNGFGKLTKKIPLPEWASKVQSIDWPKAGHFLVGGGNWIGVLDMDGKEVLKHAIQYTSFNPFHGPDGATVQFRKNEEPYLAVTSHGSSGYARSVLLIFDPKGHLVWQEETHKLRAILAVPGSDEKGGRILVGGMDGVVEYSLENQ